MSAGQFAKGGNFRQAEGWPNLDQRELKEIAIYKVHACRISLFVLQIVVLHAGYNYCDISFFFLGL